jgi:hypothetical protein
MGEGVSENGIELHEMGRSFFYRYTSIQAILKIWSEQRIKKLRFTLLDSFT